MTVDHTAAAAPPGGAAAALAAASTAAPASGTLAAAGSAALASGTLAAAGTAALASGTLAAAGTAALASGTLAAAGTAALASGTLTAAGTAAPASGAPADGTTAAAAPPSPTAAAAAPFPVVFALYPQVTQLDFTGPAEVFSRLPGARLTLASVTGGLLETESGITFAGLKPLAEVNECALLCVPGGFGTTTAMEDPAYLSALRRLAGKARYITSVCTGSLLLGAAGLLRGKRAACHWAWRELLAAFEAVPDPARVVREGNVFTGGGVTAGIDMALTVVAEIAGPDFAQTLQLALEYAPDPPFTTGRPEAARPEIVAAVRHRLDLLGASREATARRAAKALTT